MVFHKQRWWRLQARNLQNYLYNLYLRLFKPFNIIHGPGGPGGGGAEHFFNQGWLVIWLTKFCILKSGYCTRWFACNSYQVGRGLLPYIANTGMCLWTEHCPSTKSRHTRHKRAIITRHLTSTNRNIHPYIIQIRTPGKFKLSLLDIVTGRHNTVLV